MKTLPISWQRRLRHLERMLNTAYQIIDEHPVTANSIISQCVSAHNQIMTGDRSEYLMRYIASIG